MKRWNIEKYRNVEFLKNDPCGRFPRCVSDFPAGFFFLGDS